MEQTTILSETVETIEEKTLPIKIVHQYQFDKDLEYCKEYREPLEIVITACPDYTNDGERFIFDGMVHNSIGLVGRKSLRALQGTVNALESLGIPVKLTLAYADSETNDPDILKTLLLDQKTFQAKLNESQIEAYIYSSKLFSSNVLVAIDAINMSNRFFTDESLAIAERIVENLSEEEITGIIYSRSDILGRMFERNPESRQHFIEFCRSRVLVDIRDHIAFGAAVRAERSRGNKVCIASMSIPHLSKFFHANQNPNGVDSIPVIAIAQKY